MHAVLTLRGSLDARNVLGGTAPEHVREQIAAHRGAWAEAHFRAVTQPWPSANST